MSIGIFYGDLDITEILLTIENNPGMVKRVVRKSHHKKEPREKLCVTIGVRVDDIDKYPVGALVLYADRADGKKDFIDVGQLNSYKQLLY